MLCVDRELELLYCEEERQYLDSSSAFFWHNWNRFNMPPQLREREKDPFLQFTCAFIRNFNLDWVSEG
jgi:hypothetical protein